MERIQTQYSTTPASLIRTGIGSEGGSEYHVTFEDVTNSGDVALLVSHPEGLSGAGATVVAREVSAATDR